MIIIVKLLLSSAQHSTTTQHTQPRIAQIGARLEERGQHVPHDEHLCLSDAESPNLSSPHLSLLSLSSPTAAAWQNVPFSYSYSYVSIDSRSYYLNVTVHCITYLLDHCTVLYDIHRTALCCTVSRNAILISP